MQFIGKVIGNYKILEIVGTGGMGSVYKAIDVELERIVALKMISSDLSKNDAFLKRFKMEAKSLARLENPNIVKIYTLLKSDVGLFIVMEFIDGYDLAHMLKHDNPPWEQTIPIFKQILNAIGYAHESGVIHRDIKPKNIMITENGVVKVTDFGLARVEQQDGVETTYTQTMSIAGTLRYMSPEQITGDYVRLDKRIDIYALGMTFYEMLSGRTPFDKNDSTFSIQKAIVEKKFPPPSFYNPKVPDQVSKIVLKAIEKKPERRFQSIDEMKHALEFITISRTSDATVFVTSPKKRKRFTPIIMGSILALLLIISSFLFLPSVLFNKKSADHSETSQSNNKDIEQDSETGKSGYQETGQESSIVSPKIAHVRFSISPRGAQVIFDSERMGTTPLAAIEKETGQYRIEISKTGYTPYTGTIHIKNDTLVRLKLEEAFIDTSPPQVGTLLITSEPAEAEIFVDNQRRSSSRINNLSTGRHTIKLLKSGYKDSVTTAIVDQGQETRVFIRLQPLLGTVRLLVLPFGDIYIDKKLIKKEIDTWYTHRLQSGDHTIRLEHLNGRRVWEKTVKINHEKPLEIKVNFNENINVDIGANGAKPGWGYVYVDGKNTQKETPATNLQLPVGLHKLQVRHEKFNLSSEERTVLIDKEGEKKFIFTLFQKQ